MAKPPASSATSQGVIDGSSLKIAAAYPKERPRPRRPCTARRLLWWSLKRLFLAYLIFTSFWTCPQYPAHPVCRAENKIYNTVVKGAANSLLSTSLGSRVHHAYQGHIVPLYLTHARPLAMKGYTAVNTHIAPAVHRVADPLCHHVKQRVAPVLDAARSRYDALIKPYVDWAVGTVSHATEAYVIPVLGPAYAGVDRFASRYAIPAAKTAWSSYLEPAYHNHIAPFCHDRLLPAARSAISRACEATRTHVAPALKRTSLAAYRSAKAYLVPASKRATLAGYRAINRHVVPPLQRGYELYLKRHVDTVVDWDKVELALSAANSFLATSTKWAAEILTELYYVAYEIATGETHPSILADEIAAHEKSQTIIATDSKGRLVVEPAPEHPMTFAHQAQKIGYKWWGAARQWMQQAKGAASNAASNIGRKVEQGWHSIHSAASITDNANISNTTPTVVVPNVVITTAITVTSTNSEGTDVVEQLAIRSKATTAATAATTTTIATTVASPLFTEKDKPAGIRTSTGLEVTAPAKPLDEPKLVPEDAAGAIYEAHKQAAQKFAPIKEYQAPEDANLESLPSIHDDQDVVAVVKETVVETVRETVSVVQHPQFDEIVDAVINAIEARYRKAGKPAPNMNAGMKDHAMSIAKSIVENNKLGSDGDVAIDNISLAGEVDKTTAEEKTNEPAEPGLKKEESKLEDTQSIESKRKLSPQQQQQQQSPLIPPPREADGTQEIEADAGTAPESLSLSDAERRQADEAPKEVPPANDVPLKDKVAGIAEDIKETVHDRVRDNISEHKAHAETILDLARSVLKPLATGEDGKDSINADSTQPIAAELSTSSSSSLQRAEAEPRVNDAMVAVVVSPNSHTELSVVERSADAPDSGLDTPATEDMDLKERSDAGETPKVIPQIHKAITGGDVPDLSRVAAEWVSNAKKSISDQIANERSRSSTQQETAVASQETSAAASITEETIQKPDEKSAFSDTTTATSSSSDGVSDGAKVQEDVNSTLASPLPNKQQQQQQPKLDQTASATTGASPKTSQKSTSRSKGTTTTTTTTTTGGAAVVVERDSGTKNPTARSAPKKVRRKKRVVAIRDEL